MAAMKYKVFFDEDTCRVILWEGLAPGDEAEAVECKNFTPSSAQVEGDWAQGGKVSIEGSCGGKFMPDVSFTFNGVKKLQSDYLSVRPAVSGPAGLKANVYILGRRG